MVFWIILVIGLLLLLWFVAQYNGLVRLKNVVQEGWSGIDVQLKRRYDLIPNLVATVKGYSAHEQGVFEKVAQLRSLSMNATTIAGKAEAEQGLTQALKSLFAVAENYPELKAHQNFLELQKQLNDIETQVQLARRYYNGVVREYNTKIAVFPTNIVASVFSYGREPYFELERSSERENPTVTF